MVIDRDKAHFASVDPPPTSPPIKHTTKTGGGGLMLQFKDQTSNKVKKEIHSLFLKIAI